MIIIVTVIVTVSTMSFNQFVNMLSEMNVNATYMYRLGYSIDNRFRLGNGLGDNKTQLQLEDELRDLFNLRIHTTPCLKAKLVRGELLVAVNDMLKVSNATPDVCDAVRSCLQSCCESLAADMDTDERQHRPLDELPLPSQPPVLPQPQVQPPQPQVLPLQPQVQPLPIDEQVTECLAALYLDASQQSTNINLRAIQQRRMEIKLKDMEADVEFQRVAQEFIDRRESMLDYMRPWLSPAMVFQNRPRRQFRYQDGDAAQQP